MLKMKKPAFTLIEMLVVIAIVVLTSGFGFVSYFRLHDRQRVENAAKEVVTYLRGIQSKARNGDRGGFVPGSGAYAACSTPGAVNLSDASMGVKRLAGWRTTFSRSGETSILQSQAVCELYRADGSARMSGASGIGASSENDNVLRLPDGIELRCPNAGGSGIATTSCDNLQMKFAALFGDTTVVDGASLSEFENSGSSKQTFIVGDKSKKYFYYFSLDRGAITSGCMCELDGSESGTDEWQKCYARSISSPC